VRRQNLSAVGEEQLHWLAMPKRARRQKHVAFAQWELRSREALVPLRASTLLKAAAFHGSLIAQADNSPA
jgi:hypothetical protein